MLSNRMQADAVGVVDILQLYALPCVVRLIVQLIVVQCLV